MCGLCGEITFDGSAADPDAVDRMSGVLAPRGPDGSGAWAEGRVAFGHRRLKIIDLSEGGHQPMVDDDLGMVAVFNGMHLQLPRAAARAARPRATASSPPATPRWCSRPTTTGATDFVDHLMGMFAVAIVERDSGRVVLARDRLGIKPLYLAETPGGLRFASTLPALLRRRRRRHHDRPGRAAPLPHLPHRRPAAPHDPARRPQAAAGDGAGHRARRRRREHRYWAPEHAGAPTAPAGPSGTGRRRSRRR